MLVQSDEGAVWASPGTVTGSFQRPTLENTPPSRRSDLNAFPQSRAHQPLGGCRQTPPRDRGFLSYPESSPCTARRQHSLQPGVKAAATTSQAMSQNVRAGTSREGQGKARNPLWPRCCRNSTCSRRKRPPCSSPRTTSQEQRKWAQAPAVQATPANSCLVPVPFPWWQEEQLSSWDHFCGYRLPQASGLWRLAAFPCGDQVHLLWHWDHLPGEETMPVERPSMAEDSHLEDDEGYGITWQLLGHWAG